MLDLDYFQQWMRYLAEIKGWGLSENVELEVYRDCQDLTDQEFEAIARAASRQQWGKPDSLIEGARQTLLSRSSGVKALPVAVEPDGPIIGRRFLMYSKLVKAYGWPPAYVVDDFGHYKRTSVGNDLYNAPITQDERKGAPPNLSALLGLSVSLEEAFDSLPKSFRSVFKK